LNKFEFLGSSARLEQANLTLFRILSLNSARPGTAHPVTVSLAATGRPARSRVDRVENPALPAKAARVSDNQPRGMMQTSSFSPYRRVSLTTGENLFPRHVFAPVVRFLHQLDPDILIAGTKVLSVGDGRLLGRSACANAEVKEHGKTVHIRPATTSIRHLFCDSRCVYGWRGVSFAASPQQFTTNF